MYLISIYFDSETNHKLSSYMRKIAVASGNHRMTDGDVPPHITISSFDAGNQDQAIEAFQRIHRAIEKEMDPDQKSDTAYHSSDLFFASVGTFVSGVLFLSPVLDESLQHLQEISFESLKEDPKIRISRQYRPFSWFPHATMAKKLTDKEMLLAFQIMQQEFSPFHAEVVEIGLAETTPYRDLMKIKLNRERE